MSQQLKNKLTGLLPPETDSRRQVEELPTWETHVVIPLVQNLLGGLAVAGLCWVCTVGVGRYFLWKVVLDELGFWSIIVGGLVMCIATVIRFFGDDLGIVWAAYQAGQRSADSQISALANENAQLRAIARELQGQGSLRGDDLLARIEAARGNAEHLLGLAFNGQSIARAQVQPAISQRPWERAINLLKAADCLDSHGALVDRNLAVALRKLRNYADDDIARVGRGNYQPAWELGPKTGRRKAGHHGA